jgi:hypothetical protein
MKFRALIVALLLSTVVLVGCGDNRPVPQGNQPSPNQGCGNQPCPNQGFGNQPFGQPPMGGGPFGGGWGQQPVFGVQPGFGPQPDFGVQPGFGPQPDFGVQPGWDDYSWYCAYDPSLCYGDFYDDFYGGWSVGFYFGSEQVAHRQ